MILNINSIYANEQIIEKNNDEVEFFENNQIRIKSNEHKKDDLISNNNTKREYSYQNLLGVYRKSDDEEKIIETLDDMNYILDNVNLEVNLNLLSINANIDNENLQFNTILYPSQIKNSNTKNKLIGIIENSNNDDYGILKLTIEKNADESTLLTPNIDLYGKTVVSFAVYNKKSLEEYYVQFAIDNYDFDNVYNIAESYLNQNDISVEDLFNTEISYFTLTPKENFISTFNAIDEMEFQNSNSVSIYDNSEKNLDVIEDLEGKNINQLINIFKEEPINLSQKNIFINSRYSRLFI